MNYFYVTGTSRGLGRALVECLLEDEDAVVIGIARGEGISHARYRHVTLDLADVAAVSAFRFEPLPDASRVVLVNNAGVMPIVNVGEAAPEAIARALNVNTIAPALLANAFVAAYDAGPARLVVCNITSGAAERPSEGLSLYAGSKAALNQMTRAAAKEAALSPGARLSFMAVMPGSVDTEMQADLRAPDPAEWAPANMFRERYETGQVQSPDLAARRLRRVLLDPALAPDSVFDLKNLPD